MLFSYGLTQPEGRVREQKNKQHDHKDHFHTKFGGRVTILEASDLPAVGRMELRHLWSKSCVCVVITLKAADLRFIRLVLCYYNSRSIYVNVNES